MEENGEQKVSPLAEFLMQAMKERNLSITALARGIGVTYQTINTYLNGQRPSLDNCRKLSIFLDVPLARIISLVHPNVEEQQVKSLLEMYLSLPEYGQRIVEDTVYAIYRRIVKHDRSLAHTVDESLSF